ncbi:hypothetical protein C8R46DRAFT_1027016 [Mycena filopes]|nr:hypothetical protein C8R46DRAFT_1027016 [Mycena filopes]
MPARGVALTRVPWEGHKRLALPIPHWHALRAKRVAIVAQDALIPNLNCGDECNDRTVRIGMSGEFGLYQSVDGNEAVWNDHELWFNGSILIIWTKLLRVQNVAAVVSLMRGARREQTGPGLLDVLLGTDNPSGRLPFSIAADLQLDTRCFIHAAEQRAVAGTEIAQLYHACYAGSRTRCLHPGQMSEVGAREMSIWAGPSQSWV